MKPSSRNVTPQGRAAAIRAAAARQNANATVTPAPTTAAGYATPIPPPASVNTIALGDLQNGARVTEAPAVPMQDFNQFIQGYQANTAAEQAAIATNRDSIRAASDMLATRGQRGNELDAQFGLQDSYNQSAGLRTQIADLSGAFGQAIVNEEGVARPIEFITGRQAFLQAQKASQLEALSAAQAAVDGNIALAENRIERALEREFTDYETKLEAEKFELTENKELLQSKDKKAYEERVAALAERERVLGVQKADRDEALKLAVEAASEGAPQDLVAKATSAKTGAEALALVARYVGRTARLNAEASRASSYASAASSNTSRLLALAEAGDQNAVRQLGFDPNSVVNQQTLDVANIVNNPAATAYDKNTAVMSSLLGPKSKISAGSRTSLSSQLGVINSLQDLASQRESGKFKGFGPQRAVLDARTPFLNLPVFAFRNAFKAEETIQNEGYLDAINLKVQQWASGASLTAQQIEQVNKLTPASTDTDKAIQTKMNNLSNFMLTQSASTLQAEGVTFKPEKIDLFDTVNKMENLSPEQKKALKADGLII